MAERSSSGQKRMRLMAALTVLMLMSLMEFAAANGAADNPMSWLGGRQYSITNVYPFDGTPPCNTTTNTVAFYPSSSNSLTGTVTITGEFDGAGIGVCAGTAYAIPPGTTIQYFIIGNLVRFQIPDFVATASLVFYQQGQITFVGLGQDYYASTLQDIGSA